MATVADVIDDRILVSYDGWDRIYDTWFGIASPHIHPAGWCASKGVELHPPRTHPNPESFTWHDYLREEHAIAVPARAFRTRPPKEFLVAQKVEAVDVRNKALIRQATVTQVW